MKENNHFKERLKTFLADEYDKLIAYSEYHLKERFFGADAGDIIQDVALNLFSRPDINAPIENISGYIYRSIRNRIRDLYRQKNPYNSLDELDYNTYATNPEIEELEDELFSEKMTQKLEKAIDQLSPDQKAIIFATVYDGETYESLSRRWGIPAGTLLARKHRAVLQLKKQLSTNK